MKKSQIVTSEEKINASNQEIARLNEEIRVLKQSAEQIGFALQNKEKEVIKYQS